MKVSVKKKDAPKVLTIQTDFIKLEAALKYAALTATAVTSIAAFSGNCLITWGFGVGAVSAAAAHSLCVFRFGSRH